ncbi:MAG: hypothetical protein ABIP94_20430 [Planctomycetota bacterium]
MEDKIVVTHGGALRTKYGTKGFAAIRTALSALVKADKGRGFETAVVYLDDGTAMKKLKAPPVTNAKSPRAFKAAIDGVFKTLHPDYLMILGADDVVPHQDLRNTAAEDGDPFAYGDLPYACDKPYSRDPAMFVGPTRVVARLPDLTSAKEPSHLLALLKTAARWKQRTPADYTGYFGLSAAVWRGSTELSLDEVLGSHAALRLSPSQGPSHPDSVLQTLTHFINCHGAPAAPEFYGQKGNKYPIALTTKGIRKSIREGTIAAVECCYGAELYDAATLGLDVPICQEYLARGAYGFLGSTTIAYGPPDTNGAADLLCQFFLLNVLGGASVGRAALMARQQYVERVAQMDPIDLKTLAQFCVYGDPSVHPVKLSDPPGVPKSTDPAIAQRMFRSERRQKLREKGEFLQMSKPTASRTTTAGRVSPKTRQSLAAIAREARLSSKVQFHRFAVSGAPKAKGSIAKLATQPMRYHMAIGRPRADRSPFSLVCIMAKEANGKVMGYRVYQRR